LASGDIYTQEEDKKKMKRKTRKRLGKKCNQSHVVIVVLYYLYRGVVARDRYAKAIAQTITATLLLLLPFLLRPPEAPTCEPL